LIVVTGVPLTSSVHLKLDPFTVAVMGAVGVDMGVGVAVVAAGVGVVVAGVGVLSLRFWLGSLQEVAPRSKTVITANPRTFGIVFSSFVFGFYPAGEVCWLACNLSASEGRRLICKAIATPNRS
jgi:hypothetical protein